MSVFSGTIWNVGFTHIFDFSIKIDYGNDIHAVPVNYIIRNETISFDVPFRVLPKKDEIAVSISIRFKIVS